MNTAIWLRIEAIFELAVACVLYARLGASWYLFAILFFSPDIGMLGYLAGPRVGAWCYNLLHNYAIAISLLFAGWIFQHPLMISLSLIWCAHIAFDRMMGYGLKSTDSFGKTHLGEIGKAGKSATLPQGA